MKKVSRKSGKVKFNSHEQAAGRAGEVLLANPRYDFLRTYHCAFCNKWHLTKK